MLFLIVAIFAMLCTPVWAQQTFRQGIKVGPIGGVTSAGGNLAVKTSTGTDKFTVAASSGNTAVAGTFTATGAVSCASTFAMTKVNAASGSANPFDFTGTLGIMNGSDDFTLFDVNITNANHTGSTNTVQVLDVAAITGDAEATETAINIGSGWDTGITSASPVAFTSTLAVTGATTQTGALTCASTLSVAGAATIPIVTTTTITCAAGTTTLDSTYYGKIVFITGAAAQTITLPANGATAGTQIEFIITGADTSIPTFAAATADTLITVNDQAADSVTYATGHRVGACIKFISNGTYWIAINVGSTTMTVAT